MYFAACKYFTDFAQLLNLTGRPGARLGYKSPIETPVRITLT